VSDWWDDSEQRSRQRPGQRPGQSSLDPYANASYTASRRPHPTWWIVLSPVLAALSFGYFALRSGRRRLGYTQLGISVAFGIAALTVWYNNYWVHVAITESYLFISLAAVFLVCGVALVAAVVQWRDCERERPPAGAVWGARFGTLVALGLVVAPAAAATYVIEPQIQIARHSFVSAPKARPHELDESTPTDDEASAAATGDSTVPSATDAIDPSASTDSVADTVAFPEDTAPAVTLAPGSPTRVNILLLGGDAGPGRWNLRTDSMNLVSIDTETGDAAIIGVPRNLLKAPMPPGTLRQKFPRGFTDMISALFVWGSTHEKVVKEALGDTDVAGATLVTASIAELLGVPIDAWVLVDMAGFIDLIDAFGGLDVFVPKRVPAPGNIPAGKHRLPKYYEKGWQKMDGTDALAFARSRKADSDYYRMARQRCLLASIAAQKGAGGVAKHWPSVSKVVAKRVRTNMDGDLLKRLLDAARKGLDQTRTVALTPPLVPSGKWNAKTVRQIVADTISNSGKYAPKPTTTDSGPTTTHKVGQAPISGAASNIDDVCLTRKPS